MNDGAAQTGTAAAAAVVSTEPETVRREFWGEHGGYPRRGGRGGADGERGRPRERPEASRRARVTFAGGNVGRSFAAAVTAPTAAGDSAA